MTIGERIRVARKAAKMSGEQLGSTIGVGKSQISNLEKGVSHVTRANAIVLANALGVSLDWLLFGVEDKEIVKLKTDLSASKQMSEHTNCEQQLALALVEIAG
ncbi:helix-turn-helix domain-containing protein [Pontibacter vulgaris]|uniref:helix-turn-helix domain-containing protein n=1 Tax=Pontibacter vulgaris TaxID=2905679 RepID=UPI001FA787D7|nr:helix-turn-helix transcriptional regulator [Pontibacter vulgaris]